MMRVRSWQGVLAALMLSAVACSSTVDVTAQREAAPTPTAIAEPARATPAPTPTEPPPPATAAPTPTATPEPTPTPTPTPAPIPTPQPPGPCDAGPLALADPNRPIYAADLAIDPISRTVTGDLSVDFTPDMAVSEIYLRLWPNGPRPAAGGVAMTISDVFIANERTGEPAGEFEADMTDPTTARFALGFAFEAGETLLISLRFELVVPIELNSRLSGRDDYMRLGTLLPILPWEPGIGWARDPATSLFAEAVSSPVADYTVKVAVPEGYDVLASGVVDDAGVWRVAAARDFSLSVGRFRTLDAVAMAPEPVQVTVGVHETIDDDPQVYLDKIVDSLEQFSSRWGQYPWPSLTFAVTPNLSGGIEFPTHIQQGPNTQGRVTSHEVGHMFFYSLVGNNQGAAPWLDEGLTSYAEFTYEGTPANAFPIPAAGVGEATEPMTFWEQRADIYYRSVYAQTGFALQLLGPQADVDCALARYVAQNAHQIATADDFVAAFLPTFPDIVNQMAALGVDLE